MADEAQALSPISVHAATPTDADYEAIHIALVATARGQWFLGEHARRNRNADTAMVLDAISRIEHQLAMGKQDVAARRPNTQSEVPDGAIADSVANPASSLFANSLAPFRDVARSLQEIAWGLRECGGDGRICSLIDSQVAALNAGCDALDRAEPQVFMPAPPHETSPSFTEAVPDAATQDNAETVNPPGDVKASRRAATSEAPVPEIDSLGAALIASGIGLPPGILKNDPLAALRRMSQAEKIAFFS